MRHSILSILILAGCAIEVRPDGPVEVIHRVDISTIEKYIEDYCLTEKPNLSSEELDECIAEHMVNFLEGTPL